MLDKKPPVWYIIITKGKKRRKKMNDYINYESDLLDMASDLYEEWITLMEEDFG